MDREQWLLALTLSMPPTLGVLAAIRLTAPRLVLTAVAAGLLTFGSILGVVYLAVEYRPDVPEDAAVDADWPGFDAGDDDADAETDAADEA